VTTDKADTTDSGWGIIARKRVWAITGGRLPTVEDYHVALVQCLKDKAAEIERLSLTDAEREAIERACCSLGGVIDMSAECTEWDTEARETLLALLERTKPDRPEAIATGESDRPKPIADARLAALQRLAELDEELELEYGLTGNPMIKGQQHTPQTNATPGECSQQGE